MSDKPLHQTTQPAWMCNDCGTRYGRRAPVSATFHMGACGVCGSISSVTEPRDYGYLRYERHVNARAQHVIPADKM